MIKKGRSSTDIEKRWWTAPLSFIIWAGIYLLCSTLRIRAIREESDEVYHNSQFIITFWHNRTLVGPHAWRLSGFPQKIHVLTSASKDGAILSHVMKMYNIGSVRGSSHRRGSLAYMEMLTHLKDPHVNLTITPDGPKGPLYEVHPGVIKLASQTGIPIVVFNIDYESCWRVAKAWDKYPIPKPFSTVSILWRKRLFIPPNLSETDIQHYCSILKEVMSGGRPDFNSLI